MGPRFVQGLFYPRDCAAYWLDKENSRSTDPQSRGMQRNGLGFTLRCVHRGADVWKKEDVKSTRTLATAGCLTLPEHVPITSVVMAITQASVSHISTVQTE